MTKRVDWNEKEVEYCYGEEGNAMALCRRDYERNDNWETYDVPAWLGLVD